MRRGESYYGKGRRDVVGLVPEGLNNVLEIGCGNGATGLLLRESKKVNRLTGVELEPNIAEKARVIFDNVISGDIEKIEIPRNHEPYDCVICADVLEHLRDPWGLLVRLHSSIRPGGIIVASIPNIRNLFIIKELVLQGEWRYVGDGIMDMTHLRFFTKKSMKRLFQETGYHVVCMKHYHFGQKATFLNALTFRLCEEFLAQRYLVKAVKL
jgi:2-polyprenyl-3-methyl-5-hydroxy-6-metoxy-1,4-benzoquinol methylase